MPIRCSIKECCSHTSMKDVYYFEFPFSNPKLLGKWLCRIKLSNWFPSRDDYICSEHFCSYDLDFSDTTYPKLKSDAVPIKFPRPQIKVLEELITDINRNDKKLNGDKPIIKKIIINGLGSDNYKLQECNSSIASDAVLDSKCDVKKDDASVKQIETVNGFHLCNARNNKLEHYSQKNISKSFSVTQNIQFNDSDKLMDSKNCSQKILPNLSNRKLRLKIQVDKVANKVPWDNSLLNRENLQYFKSIGLEEKLSNKNVVFKIDLLGRKIKITQLQDGKSNSQDFCCKPESGISILSYEKQFSETNASKQNKIIKKQSINSNVERNLPSNSVNDKEARPGLEIETPVKEILSLDDVHTVSEPGGTDDGQFLQDDYIKKLIPVTAKRVRSLQKDKIPRCKKQEPRKINSKNLKTMKALAQKTINKSNISLNNSSTSSLMQQFKLLPIGSAEFSSYILIASPRITK